MLEKSIRLWNPWWATGKVDVVRLGVRRGITDEVIALLKSRHIKDVVGVRRCGKTTILLQVIDHLIKGDVDPRDILFLNFDDPNISTTGFDDIEIGTDRINPDTRFLFLDEVQLKDGWERWVRSLYDTGRYEQIFVTGSSSSVLSTDIGRVLSGRHMTFRLLPFSFKEFLALNGWTEFERDQILANRAKMVHYLDRFLIEGGLPEAIGKKDHERKVIHTNLFNDILVRDVVSRHGVQRDIVTKIAQYLISNVCNEYSLRRISNALDISVDTVGKYLDFLQEAELFQPLSVFSYKLRQQFKQNKKIYCVDTGLVDTVAHGQRDKAKLLENAAFLEMLRRKKEVHYWKGEKRREVDLAVKDDGVGLFQVCLDLKAPSTKKREVGSLVLAMDKYGLDTGTILTYDDDGLERVDGKDIRKVSMWRYLLGLE